jgi:hypothetical protein
MSLSLNPDVWGPHFWFTLHTIAFTYPQTPNDVTKKKYYEFIQNLPLFIPDEEMGNDFAAYLDKYPVTPYLDTRRSFMKWMHFIHNQINIKIGKEPLDYDDALKDYYDYYRPKEEIVEEKMKYKKQLIFIGFGVFLITLLFILYKQI